MTAPPRTETSANGAPTVVWSAEHVTGIGSMTELAPEWDDLVGRCRTATPFQSSGWLLAWWRHYGAAGEPCIVGVRRNGVFVAGAAVFAERRAGVLCLVPIGRGMSDITEFPVDDAHRSTAVSYLADALLAVRDWQLLDLPEVRPGSAAEDLSRRWKRRVAVTGSSVCLEVPYRSVDDLLAGGPAPWQLRRRLRRVDKAGIVCTTVDQEDLDDGVTALVDLHRRQWQGRAGNPEHLESRFHGLLTDALTDLVPRGTAQLDHYLRDGEVVAAELLLVGPRSVHTYLVGFAPSLRRDVAVDALTIRHGIDVVARRNRATLDLLRGDEAYKRRWRTIEVRHQRHQLIRSATPAVAAHLAGTLLRSGLRRWLAEGYPVLHETLGETSRRLRTDGPLAAVRSAIAGAGSLCRSSRGYRSFSRRLSPTLQRR